MKLCGNKLFKKLNDGCVWEEKTAGYWRTEKDVSTIEENDDYYLLPFPVIHVVDGFDIFKHNEFLIKLMYVESKKAKSRNFKGFSKNRWDGSKNGTHEFTYNGWVWPCGYFTYLSQGVLPSRSFYKFITKDDCENLPTYL
jgi:hypothetical protein